MRLLLLILRPIYYLLYHHFAWTYDFVADMVSLGQWRDWVRTALPHLDGRVLELGFGPGHLQLFLAEKGLVSFGVDESRFMARQASRRLRKAGADRRLARGLAQSLPFPDAAFDTVAATFPAEYIFDPRTLTEVHRVLAPGGRFVILPVAWVTGIRPLERFVAWLNRVSGEAPGEPGQLPAAVQARFAAGRFEVRKETVTLPRSKVLVVIAKKSLDESIDLSN
ncbi:MAG: type 11 methyltransferase [Anaerolineaceae bacterium]|nr:MAG: type 11 methyltransferase [Anaerolineaceae bacterium]